MTSDDSDMLSLGDVVSWDDLATLLALANIFEMPGSWSSYKKTLGRGTIQSQNVQVLKTVEIVF
jgi:hypothetical protein